MLRALPFLLLLSFAVVLAGCRETVAGPDPLTPPPPSAPGEQGTPLYIKGPSSLRVHEQMGYRAEPLRDARLDHYEWGYYGDGDLTAIPVDPEGFDRLIEARASEAGTIVLYVRAYDAQGNRLAYGDKEVSITPY